MLVATAGSTCFGAGCGAIAEDVADAAGAFDAAPIGDAGFVARDASKVDAEEPDPPLPAGLPPGWVRFDGYSKACGLFIPKSRDLLPDPLAFQPCPQGVNPPGVSCRFIDPTWSSAERPQLMSQARRATRSASGDVHIQASKFVGDWICRLVIDADGRVEHAVLETNPKFCTLIEGYLHAGRYAYPIATYGGLRYGVLAGRWSELAPSVVLDFEPDGLGHTPLPTPFGVLDRSRLYAWDTGKVAVDFSAAAPAGQRMGSDLSVGDSALFGWWSSSGNTTLRVYTPAGGVKDLGAFGEKVTQDNFGLGTDGIDLVWQHAFGRTSGLGPYPSFEIMTAPFTTSGAAFAPRRVRSAPGGVTLAPAVVGCGYTAQRQDYFVRIVRLADGAAWELRSADSASSIHWEAPIALTCDELFLGAAITGTPKLTIARIRLDSLGPGIPAD